MPFIAAQVDDAVKAGFTDLARQHGMSESELLRRMVGQQLGQASAPTPATVEDRRGPGSRQVKFRLWGDERVAVEQLAAADSLTVPAWVASLVRRSALHAVPFNPAELGTLRAAIAALGPLGRNLNTLVRYWHQTGRIDSEAVATGNMASAVSALRQQVVDLVDRASKRYTPPDPSEAGLVLAEGEGRHEP